MDLNVEEQKENKDNTWKSCCLKVDKNAVKYFIQVSILSSLILTSLTMLIYDKSCDSQRWWSGLLTLCLGVFLPAPKMT
jgi:hypothetical protein